MLLILLTTLSAILYQEVEAKTKMFLQDMEVDFVDPEYFDPDECSAGVVPGDDENMSYLYLKVTKDLPCDAQGDLTVWQLSNGEYDLPTGIAFKRSLKECFDDVTTIGPVLHACNLKDCPLEAGTYKMDNYTLDDENQPDNFPDGEFKAVFKLMSDPDTDIARVNVYFLPKK